MEKGELIEKEKTNDFEEAQLSDAGDQKEEVKNTVVTIFSLMSINMIMKLQRLIRKPITLAISFLILLRKMILSCYLFMLIPIPCSKRERLLCL
jgi:hypothetical protein